MKRQLLPVCLFSLMASALPAQVVRGVAVADGDRAIPGVVMALIDSAQKASSRALTNERGEFRLVAPAPGNYRIRATRIGFKPTTTAPFAVPAAGEIERRVSMTSIPVALQPVTSAVRTACRLLGLDSTVATYAVWEQIRAALTAADITTGGGAFNTKTLTYERRLTLNNSLVRQEGRVTTAAVSKPWHSVSPDSLRRAGWVVTQSDGETRVFHGPDLTILLSPEFAEDHCFRMVGGADSTRLGVAFEPTPQRRNLPEIKGTLWVDRASAELRSIEYQYVNVARNVDDTETAGYLQFSRLTNGGWVISRWNIRLPLVEMSIATRDNMVQFRGIKIDGGELISAASTDGADTLFATPSITLNGVAYDSLQRAPLAMALIGIAGTGRTAISDSLGRFSFERMPLGTYRLLMQHENLEAVGITTQAAMTVLASEADTARIHLPSFTTIWRLMCGGTPPAGDTAMLYGTIRALGRQRPVARATVTANWVELNQTSKNKFDTKRLRLDAESDSTGGYVLCGVPTQTGLRLRAATDSAVSGLIDMNPLEERRVVRRDLVISFDPNVRGIVAGVVRDKNGAPMRDARVVADGAKEARTDGAGRFILRDVPLGTQQLEALAIGLQPVTTVVEVTAVDTAHVQISLAKPVVLRPVNIVASSVRQQFVRDFNDRRDKGLGHFRDSTVIGMHGTLHSVIAQVPGARMTRNEIRFPGTGVVGRDGQLGCPAHIWLDGVLLQVQEDFFALRPTDIAAIEVYGREMIVPTQYLVRRAGRVQCGVIVVWTKWYWEGNRGSMPATGKPPR